MADKTINFEGKYDFPSPTHLRAHFHRFVQIKLFEDLSKARKHRRRWERKLADDIKAHQALAYIFSFDRKEGQEDQVTYTLGLYQYNIDFQTSITIEPETGEYVFRSYVILLGTFTEDDEAEEDYI